MAITLTGSAVLWYNHSGKAAGKPVRQETGSEKQYSRLKKLYCRRGSQLRINQQGQAGSRSGAKRRVPDIIRQERGTMDGKNNQFKELTLDQMEVITGGAETSGPVQSRPFR